MQRINRTLLALALGALLAAPALASEKVPTAKQPTATTRSSDAVSARATTRETGRMKESPANTGTTVGATGTVNANPGKGNWWADADIDGDGQLSAAEAKANAGLHSRFSSVDTDTDGYLSNEEYRRFYAGSASQGELQASAHSAVVTRDVWMKLDSNDDGKLSSTEVSGNGSISGAFGSIDGNGDGFVTQAEYSAYAKANRQ